jgi:hypothetical protein
MVAVSENAVRTVGLVDFLFEFGVPGVWLLADGWLPVTGCPCRTHLHCSQELITLRAEPEADADLAVPGQPDLLLSWRTPKVRGESLAFPL